MYIQLRAKNVGVQYWYMLHCFWLPKKVPHRNYAVRLGKTQHLLTNFAWSFHQVEHLQWTESFGISVYLQQNI